MDLSQVLVEVLSEEGSEGSHHSAEGHLRLVKSGEGDVGIVITSLDSSSVQTNVDVRELVDEGDELGNDGVESVALHLLAGEADEVLDGSLQSDAHETRTYEKPLIHDVGAVDGSVLAGGEGLAVLVLPVLDVLDEESVGVVPRKEDVLQGRTQRTRHTLISPWTPLSTNLRGSARTTGLLMR